MVAQIDVSVVAPSADVSCHDQLLIAIMNWCLVSVDSMILRMKWCSEATQGSFSMTLVASRLEAKPN
jgi:hypothetical protein